MASTVFAETKKAAILPLITFYSTLQEGEVYNGWAENSSNGEMKKLSVMFHGLLAENPLSRWNYLPLEELLKDVPLALRVTTLSEEQTRDFAIFKKAAIVVSGDVKIMPSPLIPLGVRWIQNLAVIRVKNGKKISESLKIIDIPQYQYQQMLLSSKTLSKDFVLSSFQELHEKIENFRDRKVAPQSELVLTGEMSEFVLQQLKEKIRQRHSEITAFKIIELSRDQVTYLAEGIDSARLSQTLSEFSFKNKLSRVVSTDSSRVVFAVQAKNAIE